MMYYSVITTPRRRRSKTGSPEAECGIAGRALSRLSYSLAEIIIIITIIILIIFILNTIMLIMITITRSAIPAREFGPSQTAGMGGSVFREGFVFISMHYVDCYYHYYYHYYY